MECHDMCGRVISISLFKLKYIKGTFLGTGGQLGFHNIGSLVSLVRSRRFKVSMNGNSFFSIGFQIIEECPTNLLLLMKNFLGI